MCDISLHARCTLSYQVYNLTFARSIQYRYIWTTALSILCLLAAEIAQSYSIALLASRIARYGSQNVLFKCTTRQKIVFFFSDEAAVFEVRAEFKRARTQQQYPSAIDPRGRATSGSAGSLEVSEQKGPSSSE